MIFSSGEYRGGKFYIDTRWLERDRYKKLAPIFAEMFVFRTDYRVDFRAMEYQVLCDKFPVHGEFERIQEVSIDVILNDMCEVADWRVRETNALISPPWRPLLGGY